MHAVRQSTPGAGVRFTRVVIVGAMVAVLGVVGPSAWSQWTRSEPPGEDDDHSRDVLIVIEHAPANATVDVVYAINGEEDQVSVRNTRWTKVLRRRAVTSAMVHAYQPRDARLSYTLYVDGSEVDHSTRDDAGSIRCYYNRSED